LQERIETALTPLDAALTPLDAALTPLDPALPRERELAFA
jgi:hypothetical protein